MKRFASFYKKNFCSEEYLIFLGRDIKKIKQKLSKKKYLYNDLNVIGFI